MIISVVTITYNDCLGLARTIESVLNQTARKSIEYIVINGASTDGTSELLDHNVNDIDIIVSEPDKGIYDAMNKGLTRATGDYVIFMNSGDVFSDGNVIKNVIDNIDSTKRFPAIVYGNYRESKSGIAGNPIPCRRPSRIWYGPVASHQSTFYHIPTLHRLGLCYDTTYRIAADYKLTLSTLSATDNDGLKLDICISDFDISGASNINQNRGLDEANRARREVLGWGAMRSAGMKALLLSARYAKRYMRPIYNIVRNH